MRLLEIRLAARLVATVAFVAAILASVSAGAAEGRVEATRSTFRIAPYLQNASPDAITIMWETKHPLPSAVEYWELPSDDQPEFTVSGDASVKIHRLRVAGLNPDTHYGYRVRCGEEVREGDFITAPVKSRPIRFAVVGDSRFWKDYWQTTRLPQHFLSQKPEFILHMGDLVNNGLRHREWQGHFRRFETVLGRVPLFPARGNHERDGSKNPENDWFAKYHELPGGEPYSSFDWGNSHFCIVSFTHIEKCASFLEEDLASSTKKWKFVAFHYPVYCTGYMSASDSRKASGNRELEAIFDKHRVDMVFSGHTHIYERSLPIRAGKRDDRNGTVYLVQGGAVGGNYPDRWTATIARDLSLPHYSVLEVGDDRIELRSYGLAKGDQNRGEAARIIEIDRYIKWRDEALPRRMLEALAGKKGSELVETIENLGAMSYGPAAEALVAYLGDKDEPVRRAAAIALARIADEAVSERLVCFLGHEDIVVRRNVARALEAAMLRDVAGKILEEILDNGQDKEVRISLLGAMQLHAPQEAFPVAMKVLRERDGEIRDRAAYVIKRTASEKDGPVLVELLREEKRPYVAACLAWAISR